MIPMRKIYTTAEWGAREALRVFPATTPKCIVVHHTSDQNRPLMADPKQAEAYAFDLAKRIQNFHMDSNGWSDSGQHFLITRDGIILESRHGSLDALLAGHCIRGAHAADPDTGADANDSPGIEHEGLYLTAAMPQPQWESSIWLTAYIAFRCGLDTQTIIGHRDVGCLTQCPGDWFHDHIVKLRQYAHAVKLSMIGGTTGAS